MKKLALVSLAIVLFSKLVVAYPDFLLAPGDDVVFIRTSALWTNVTELGDGTGTSWDTIASNLASVAASEQGGSFPETITSGEWGFNNGGSPTGRCEPIGGGVTDNEVLEQASRAIYGLALDWVVNADATSASTARTQILNVAATNQFGNDETYSGRTNECVLALGESVPNIVNAALLLEESGYSAWMPEDRVTLATWLAEEAFPPLSYGSTTSKNNWGITSIGGAYAAAVYVEGGYRNDLIGYDGTTYSAANLRAVTIYDWLDDWLAANVVMSSTCEAASEVYGQQSNGSFPDELRRSTNFSVAATENCGAADLEFSCSVSGGANSYPYNLESDCDNGIFYQQKSTSNLVRLAEMVRRVEGSPSSGSYVYSLSSHNGASTSTNIYDALLYSTTSSTTEQGDFQDYRVETAFISGFNVAGAYYRNQCIIDALRATDATYFNRGGLDFPWTALTHFPGLTNTAPSACPSGDSFVALADSALSSLESRFPYTYVSTESETPLVDHGSWATTVSLNADGTGQFSSCNALQTGDTGTIPTDNSTNILCFWNAASDDTKFTLADGDYYFDQVETNAVLLEIQPSEDHRGIVGASRSGTRIILGGIWPTSGTQVNFMEGPSNNDANGATTDWIDGYTRGTTTIRVASSAGFTEGGWIYLTANPAAVQPEGSVQYKTRITSIDPDGSTLVLDRRLPDDFSGGGQLARPWTPTEEVFFENMTITYKNPEHQRPGFSNMFKMRNMADSHVKNVHLDENYQYALTAESSARLRIEGNIVNGVTDKPFNNYGITISGTSDSLILNNTIYNYPEAVVCASNGQQNMFAFNFVANPEANPLYSTSGTTFVDHSEIHGPVISPDGYLHCSSQLADAQGGTGSRSCRGTRISDSAGSMLHHDFACSNTVYVRNHIEGGIWADFSFGPGRNNWWFGFAIKPGDPSDGGPVGGGYGEHGDIGTKVASFYNPNGGTYRRNMLLLNSNFNELGTGDGFDAFLDDAVIQYNVMRGDCYYDGGGTPDPETDTACSPLEGGLDAGDVSGDIDWAFNDVNRTASTPTWSATMPTAPGFGSWVESYLTGGAGTFPWIGADMGVDGGAGVNCLPAYMRYYGSCP